MKRLLVDRYLPSIPIGKEQDHDSRRLNDWEGITSESLSEYASRFKVDIFLKHSKRRRSIGPNLAVMEIIASLCKEDSPYAIRWYRKSIRNEPLAKEYSDIIDRCKR